MRQGKQLAVLLLFLVPSVLFATPGLELESTRYAVGEPIKATLSGYAGDIVHWFWNGETGGDTYTPTPNDYESWICVEAYGRDGEPLAKNRLFFSTLPVVYINTEGGVPVLSRDNYLSADMFIQGGGEYEDQYDGSVLIKGRGTSSWHYDKKPYKLKLEKKTDLFGFGKSKHYVLLASYLDPSLMRNALAFDLSSRLGLTTPDYEWVDLVFNGEYAGTYLLVEHVRVGSQMVDIYDWGDCIEDAAKALYKSAPSSFPEGRDKLEDAMEEDLSWVTTGIVSFAGKEYSLSGLYELPEETAGGYLFELGFNKVKEASHFTTKGGIVIGVSHPEFLSSNSVLMEEAMALVQDFEDAVRSPDGYNKKGQHYTELADLDSMVSYWLTMEILSNEDAAGRSRFAYMDKDLVLHFGPVWDFDIALGAFRAYFPPKAWNVTATVTGWFLKQDIFSYMVDDPLFQTRARETYWRIHSYLEELVADGGIIDSYYAELYEAGVANEILWTQDGYMSRTFSGEHGDYAYLKSFLKKRLQWMDKVFATEESLARSLRLLPLAPSHYSTSSRVKLTLQNGIRSQSAKDATYLLGDNLVLAGTVPSRSRISLLLNGIFWKNVDEEELKSGVAVPVSLLDVSHQNVLEVVVEKGKRTYRNYVTVGSPLSVMDEPSASSICIHQMTTVEERTLSDSQYGLQSSFYCMVCHQYFQDEEGKSPLPVSSVVLTPKHCASPGGMGMVLKLALLGLVAVLLLLVLLLVFLFRWLRKRKRKKNGTTR